MKKYVLFEHAGSGNHGCEAIVRSTIDMLGKNNYYLESASPSEDMKFSIDDCVNLLNVGQDNISPNSIKGIVWRAQGKINKKYDFDDRNSVYRHRELLMKDSVALSIGGDNYCYGGIIGSMRDKLRAFEMKGIPVVLWGCSVDREHLDENTIKDLRKYALITARESMTVEILQEKGISKTVVQCADPAFTLKKQRVSWNGEWLNAGNVIGINVSDFMKYYNAYPEATLRNFKQLINYILRETEYSIALIPHVRQEGNDDFIPINMLATEFKSERIRVLSEELNCMQLKDAISRCCMFIGCRTHSTIAAYSTCVPTLVVGYSVKAKGICQDIFGYYDDLLVDVREFSDDNDLTRKFVSFAERKDDLKKHLNSFMPQYIERTYIARDALLKMIKNR